MLKLFLCFGWGIKLFTLKANLIGFHLFFTCVARGIFCKNIKFFDRLSCFDDVLHGLQRNLFFPNAIWSGSFSVQGIKSTQMAHVQTEPPELATGKPLEKTGK